MKKINVTLCFDDGESDEDIIDTAERVAASLNEDIKATMRDDVQFASFEEALPLRVDVGRRLGGTTSLDSIWTE
jgi:hypothetical protein